MKIFSSKSIFQGLAMANKKNGYAADIFKKTKQKQLVFDILLLTTLGVCIWQ